MKFAGLLVGLTVLVAAACSGGYSGTSTPTGTATTESQGGGQQLCGGGSLEGCFTYAQMDEYLNAITPMISRFYQDRYPNVPLPEVVYVPSGQQGASPCGSVASSQSFEYCGANGAVYVGQDVLWEFYSNAGDAAPAIGLAHEFGHNLQLALGLPTPQTAAQSVQFENQADCISGAWAKYADQQGWLETQDDIQDVETLIGAIGSREGRGRDHGTPQEREQAFFTGFNQDIQACNAYGLRLR